MHSIGRFFTIAALLFASGCRIDTNQPPAATAQGSTGVATAQAVSVTADGVLTDSLTGETAIADNFDGSTGIERTTYPIGTGGGTPPVSTDVVGAFRMFCTGGQISRDDPLFYPGQPGASHLHQFFGNTGANASSNYASLRTSGGTTCGQSSTPFNRSAYWYPAMLDGAGSVVKPDFLNVYYKRNPLKDPMCSLSSAQHLGQCVDLPNGLRFAFGYNMFTGTNGITDPNSPEHWSIRYECWASNDGTVTAGAATGHYWTIADVAKAGCPVGAQLVILVNAPNCWDGTHLDAADHRSHMAWGTGTYYAGQMFNACPASHPYVIPDMQVQIHFTVDANFVAGKWYVSSDEMVPGVAPGSTFHMDYWEAWSPSVKATWHQNCINAHLTCAGGDLGNGTAMKGGDVPSGGWVTHQLVALTTIPGTTATPPTTTTTPTPTTQVCPDGSVISLTQACPQPLPAAKPGKGVGRRK